MQETDWHGKVAIVCGASSGLGLSLTRRLALQGVRQVLVVARDATKLDATRNELLRDFPTVEFTAFAADMTEEADVRRLAQYVTKLDATPSLLVQAVGKSDRGALKALEESHLDSLLALNVRTSLYAIRFLAPTLKQPGGTIVLIGSLASKFAPRFLGGYAIAKHALAALAAQSRLELAESGIHVLLACPGPIARMDAGQRYAGRDSADLPSEALQPGGGAKISGLDADRLADDILWAAKKRKPEIIRPRKARLLCVLAAISPRLGDWILRRKTS